MILDRNNVDVGSLTFSPHESRGLRETRPSLCVISPQCISHADTHTHSHTHTLTLTHTLTHSHSHSHSLTHSHSHTLTLTHTQTQTHTLSTLHSTLRSMK